MVKVRERLVRTTINGYNHSADNYTAFQSSLGPVRLHLKFFCANLKGKKVLDIGCGHGRETKYLEEQGLEIMGIDLSEKLLEIARKNVLGVDFQLMDMRELEFADNSFDGLWINTSFLHLPRVDAERTLAGFHRVLKQGGLMLLSVQGHPNELARVVEEISPKEKLIATEQLGWDNPRLFTYYDVDELRKLLKKAGFNVIRVVTKKEEVSKILWIDTFSLAVK